MERSGHQVLAVENQPSEVPFGFTFSFDEDFILKLYFVEEERSLRLMALWVPPFPPTPHPNSAFP